MADGEILGHSFAINFVLYALRDMLLSGLVF